MVSSHFRFLLYMEANQINFVLFKCKKPPTVEAGFMIAMIAKDSQVVTSFINSSSIREPQRESEDKTHFSHLFTIAGYFFWHDKQSSNIL